MCSPLSPEVCSWVDPQAGERRESDERRYGHRCLRADVEGATDGDVFQ